MYAFLRFSRAISALALSLLCLTDVEFFDDFTQVEADALCQSAQNSMEGLLNLLGWDVAMEEKKRKPFQKSFVALGVQIDFGKSGTSRIIELGNKEGRVADIKSMVEGFLQRGAKMGFKEALSVRGKISFAEGQVHARLAAPATRLLSEWAKVDFARPISDGLKLTLCSAVKHLETAPPRVVEVGVESPPPSPGRR